jgi:hypothetical protein
MLIARSCFEAFQAKWPDRWVTPHVHGMSGKLWIYFDCCIEQKEGYPREYLSEDYYFCHRMADLGITPKFIPCITLKHTGTYVFGGCKLCSEGSLIHNLGQKEPKQEPTNEAQKKNEPQKKEEVPRK